MAQSHLTITPNTTYPRVNQIQIRAYSSTNGSCSGITAFNNFGPGTADSTISINVYHSYITTDASNCGWGGAQTWTP